MKPNDPAITNSTITLSRETWELLQDYLADLKLDTRRAVASYNVGELANDILHKHLLEYFEGIAAIERAMESHASRARSKAHIGNLRFIRESEDT